MLFSSTSSTTSRLHLTSRSTLPPQTMARGPSRRARSGAAPHVREPLQVVAHPPAAQLGESASSALRRVAAAGGLASARCGRRSHRVVDGARRARRSSGSARARPHITAAARSCAGEQHEAAAVMVSGAQHRRAVEYVSGSEDINFGYGGVRPACSQRSRGRWPGAHSDEPTRPQPTARSPRSSGRSQSGASVHMSVTIS